ncbi:MAG: hypothetical protein IT304_11475 [Dehalococcoidia bacterium]|nr:hypothetical protein [Dehalococcoidia bacterium]
MSAPPAPEEEAVRAPVEATARKQPALVAGLRSLVPYAVAFVIFVGLGVADPRFMLNWSPGLVLLLAVVWAIPALWRRWRRRR